MSVISGSVKLLITFYYLFSITQFFFNFLNNLSLMRSLMLNFLPDLYLSGAFRTRNNQFALLHPSLENFEEGEQSIRQILARPMVIRFH